MDRRQCSFDTYALLQAATIADDEGVQRALMMGADVNGADATGRTALTNIIMGESWQTIDASDASSFMSSSRLNILRTLVSRRDISLFTLNAPRECMNDVSPLGMCAWLNIPEAVRVLLDCCAGRTLVDGMDSLGATPLMYAARDGNIDVVELLLDHGARPDFKDVHHRTPIQYALRHSGEALWLCEVALRSRRRHETRQVRDIKISNDINTQPIRLANPSTSSAFTSPLIPLIFTDQETSKYTNKLIHAVRSSDLTLLDLLLPSSVSPLPSSSPPPLPSTNTNTNSTNQTNTSNHHHHHPLPLPVLVNKPDSNGWSLIHHCTASERPSIAVLDALYYSGVDVNLFTTSEHYTPLHCLARFSPPSSSRVSSLFALHLIRDLHAPLSARDRENETCIHIAAEHGECVGVLIAFLECDKDKGGSGGVRGMRNSRGLTALEVAKPQFRAVFEMERCLNRPQSSTSTRTIRPGLFTMSPSPPSSPRPSQESNCLFLSSPSQNADFDVTAASHCFLDHLRFISSELSHHHMQPMHLETIHNVFLEAAQARHDILSYFRAQVDDARKELDSARAMFCRVDMFWRAVACAVEWRVRDLNMDARGGEGDKQEDEGLLFKLAVARRATRHSGDSQATAVSDTSAVMVGKPASSKSKSGLLEEYVSVAEYKDVCVATDPPVLLNTVVPQAVGGGVRTVPWPEWLNPSGDAAHHHHTRFLVPLLERRPASPRLDIFRNMLTGQKKETGLDDGRRTPKLSSSDVTAKNGGGGGDGGSGSSRFKTWFKKKMVPDHRSSLSLEIVVDTAADEGCPVGREVKEADCGVSPPQRETKCETAGILMEPTLRAPVIPLLTASRDLASIEECITAADHFVATAYRSISRAERIAHRALEARRTAIENLCVRHAHNPAPELFTSFSNSASSSDLSGYANWPYSKSSSSTVSSIFSSPHSSCVSLVSTLTDVDDGDTKALRGLLHRKIEARLGGSFDEIDQVIMWLRIVKEVVRGVKNRTGL